MHRIPLILALATLYSAAFVGAEAPGIGPGYDLQMGQMIPVRDGIELEAWIWRPSGLEEPAPTVLALTQYDIDGARRGNPAKLTARGYVFVQTYVRGRGRSGGSKNDNLGLQVGRDGHDVVEWIAGQPWSDGRVVMYGGSFVGMTQWRTAAQHPPHLASIAPYVSIYPGWDVPNTNGIPQAWTNVILGFVAGRSLNQGFAGDVNYWSGKMYEHYAAYRPFHELDDVIGIDPDDWWMLDAAGRRRSFLDVWLDHVGDESFNLAAEPTVGDYSQMHLPILSVTGYFDDDQPGTLRYYRGHTSHGPPDAVAKHHLVIGPWDHGGAQQPRGEIMGLRVPAAAVFDMDEFRADWYDWALGRGEKPDLLADRVAYFMMGPNEWRFASSLEAASSGEYLTLYLSEPDGTPESVFRSGRLAASPSNRQPPATVVSDPRELPDLMVAGYSADEDLTSQFRAFQKQAVTFHSQPFKADKEIAGHMQLVLTVKSDAPDFDLWSEVLMILPDGSAIQLGEDIRRARFRNGPFNAELLGPDEVVEIPFEYYWAALRIPAGARLRLTIAPLNSHRYQKNFNSGGRVGYESIENARVATIRVFHDAERPSRLILPLAARSGSNTVDQEVEEGVEN